MKAPQAIELLDFARSHPDLTNEERVMLSNAADALEGAQAKPAAADTYGGTIHDGRLTVYRNGDEVWSCVSPQPAEVPALRQALEELVSCKDLKEELAAVRPYHRTKEFENRKAQYERRQPLAWEAARAALAPQLALKEGGEE